MSNHKYTGIESTLKWGILGTGNIARQYADALQAHDIEVVSVGSRTLASAEEFIKERGIANAYGSYEELLADAAVDAVYISLPNHMHAEWSIKCAEAGKHILCEKPLALSEAEAISMVDAAKKADVFFMEGFMYRFHPQWDLVKKLIQDGKIGEVRSMHASFSYNMGVDLSNIRQSYDACGGGLMDVGCYCLSFIRMIAGEEPTEAHAVGHVGEASRVDEWMAATMKFGNGITATFQSGTRVGQPVLAVIYGDKGRIEIPGPWHPSDDEAKVTLFAGKEEETFTVGDGLKNFARQAYAVEKHLADRQCPDMSWDDSIGQAKSLADLRQSLGLGF